MPLWKIRIEIGDINTSRYSQMFLKLNFKENNKSKLYGMFCVTKKKKEIYRMHLNDTGYDKL